MDLWDCLNYLDVIIIFSMTLEEPLVSEAGIKTDPEKLQVLKIRQDSQKVQKKYVR